MIGPYLPFLVGFSREDVRRLFPFFEKNVWNILMETGYLHIQGTKPDTAGGDATRTQTLNLMIHIDTVDRSRTNSMLYKEFILLFPVFCNLSMRLFELSLKLCVQAVE